MSPFVLVRLVAASGVRESGYDVIAALTKPLNVVVAIVAEVNAEPRRENAGVEFLVILLEARRLRVGGKMMA